LPSAVVAIAAQAVVGWMTTRQPLAPHCDSAIAAAFFGVGWFQIQPLLPVCASQAIAPQPAIAGTASSEHPSTASALMVHLIGRIEPPPEP
jgi:hypothetical protein